MEEVNYQALTLSYVTATEQPPCCLKQVVKTCESTMVFDTESMHKECGI